MTEGGGAGRLERWRRDTRGKRGYDGSGGAGMTDPGGGNDGRGVEVTEERGVDGGGCGCGLGWEG